MFRKITKIEEGTDSENLELYGFTEDGKVYRAFGVVDLPEWFAETALELERQAAEGEAPYSTITDYQLRSLRDSQEIKLNQILEELSHSSSTLPSLAAPLAA